MYSSAFPRYKSGTVTNKLTMRTSRFQSSTANTNSAMVCTGVTGYQPESKLSRGVYEHASTLFYYPNGTERASSSQFLCVPSMNTRAQLKRGGSLSATAPKD